MWDSLGVLGLKAGSAVARVGSRLGELGRLVRHPIPRAAGFAIGGTLVPPTELPHVRPTLSVDRIRRLLTLRWVSLPRARRWRPPVWFDRVRRLVPRLGLADAADEAVPLRVPLDEQRPPLIASIARLAVAVVAAAVALSAVVYAFGSAAVRTLRHLIG